VIEVRYDGIDVSEGDIARLGSGLVISRTVVAGHGGTLLYKSDSGRDTQFSIWIPLDV
jgi:signal transduction histidine kinase